MFATMAMFAMDQKDHPVCIPATSQVGSLESVNAIFQWSVFMEFFSQNLLMVLGSMFIDEHSMTELIIL